MKQRSEFNVQSSGFKVQALRSHPSSLIPHPSPRCAAFTLIEIMVVIAIILVLVSIVIAGSKYVLTKAGTSRVKAEIAAMETALESFKNDNGVYPQGDNTITSSVAVYNALAGGSKWYMTFRANQLQTNTVWNSNTIMDIFGRPYYYQYPGVSNPVSFDLWSAGPDARSNTVDDIVNWRQ